MIIPLTITQVNWSELFKTIKEVEGRDLGRYLDLSQTKVGCPDAYFKVLKEFGKEPLSDEKLKKFIYLSFLTDIDIFDGFNLDVLKSKKSMLIVGGTLSQWQIAVIDGCQQNSSEESLRFYNGVFQFCTLAGLQSLWNSYQKEDSGQGTFYLWKP